MPVDGRFKCHCQNPVPLEVNGEDSGLCEACTYIYDERLYHDQLRKNWRPDPTRDRPPLPEDTDDLDAILRVVSPDYRALVGIVTPSAPGRT